MTKPRHLRARYRKIVRFSSRYIAQEWFCEIVLPRIGLARIAKRGRTARATGIARHFREVAVDLGGLMIKVGQFMSSRLDVLNPEITNELETLQDEVPAVDFALIRASAEAELGMPLERAYSFVDPVPVAAASLGQVHRATLSPFDATEMGFDSVVIKVQRPGIDEIVRVDLAALRKIAARLNRVTFISRRVDLPALLDEFAIISEQEIDYLHEAGNAEAFVENFAENDYVQAPTVVWERTTRRVLTLSDVTAIKINNREALIASGIDPAAVAVSLSSAMFDQIFTHGFFHADPHPGNIFVTPLPHGPRGPNGQDWALTFVDFGMMGKVPEVLRSGLQRLVIAVSLRDAKGLVASIKDMGVLLPSAESEPLERAMTKLFHRFGGMGFAELQKLDLHEYRDFAKEFGNVMRSMPFQLPEDMLLIIRSVSVTSGVCTALDPEFNVWTAIEPYAKQLTRQERGGAVRMLAQQAITTAGLVAGLPRQLDEISTMLTHGKLSIETPGVERGLRVLETLGRRVISAMLFAGLLIGGIFLKQSDPAVGWALMGVSGLPLLHAMFLGTRSRQRSR